MSNKRRSTGIGGRTDAVGTSQNRRAKHPAYFIPELAHVVALCDERIPFVTLAQEVRFKSLVHFYIIDCLSLEEEKLPFYEEHLA